jgi:signal peptidase I
MSAHTLEEIRSSLAGEVLFRQGVLNLRAFGTSMLPTLWPGDLATVQSCNFDDVQAGDIVLYLREGRLYLHRVTRKVFASSARCLVTRGDSMPAEDPPVRPVEVLGKVVEIRHHGAVVVPTGERSIRVRILSCILGHSSLCMRVLMRLRGRLEVSPELAPSNANL